MVYVLQDMVNGEVMCWVWGSKVTVSTCVCEIIKSHGKLANNYHLSLFASYNVIVD